MPYDFLKSRLCESRTWSELLTKVQGRIPCTILGTPGLLTALCIAELHRQTSRRCLVVCPQPVEAQQLRGDVELLTGRDVGYFASYDRYFFRDPEQNHDVRWERLRVLEMLQEQSDAMIIAPIQGLLYPVVSRETIKQSICRFSKGETRQFSDVLETLVSSGFVREQMVESVGELSVRGGLIDVYPPTLELPVRLEFDFDEIVSIRSFDPSTQRSLQYLDTVSFTPPMVELQENPDGSNNNTLLEHLQLDDLVVLVEPLSYERHAQTEIEKIQEYWTSTGNGEETGCPTFSLDRFGSYFAHLKHRAALQFSWTPVEKTTIIDFRASDPPAVRRNLSALSAEIRKLHRERGGYSVRIYCDNPGQVERLQEYFDDETDLPAPPVIETGEFSGGFVFPEARLAVFLDHQIFLRERIHRRRRSRSVKKRDSLFHNQPLSFGDLVVHEQYGIGKYVGLFHITVNGAEQESLKIRYDGGDHLFVNIDKLYQLEKFSSQEDVVPKLNRLGTTEWERVKAKTKKAIASIAGELLTIYAKRKMRQGHAFKADGHWQLEMEGAFPYEETEDQLKVTAEIKADMESAMPMDRVVCGDVGFGKTEVAVRAAFKAASEGKQVAVLAPTTILVQQHFDTFRSRMERYPIRIESLSRFRTPKEQKVVLVGIEDGTVDIVIGTHRLLSKDVQFKNLGLMIVDEEQRFGVTHKERLKKMRSEVDVLTLTATPIPRTLSMSLMGARDLSTINIPPHNRLPVINEITPFNESTIRNAILRELDRGGQVYFVHNRVKTIDVIADQLQQIVPGLRCGIAHGQMHERTLEKVMVDFLRRKYDCLVSTMIIESGLDIPNVNTILINNAEHFGLSQLYQLRGRVGRSHVQGYAYFLVQSFDTLDDVAVRRLRTIREHSDLGSGLKVALRDLEIRGSGNLLGREQSGHINAVGFDLYNKLVEETVRELQSTMPEFQTEVAEQQTEVLTDVQTDVDSYLPDDYISYGEFRTEFYQRIGKTFELTRLNELEEELRDRFGLLPPPARALMDLMAIRVLGGKLGFKSITVMQQHFRALVDAETLNDLQIRDLATRIVGHCTLPIEFIQLPGFGIRIQLNQNTGVERLVFIRNVLESVYKGFKGPVTQ